LRREQGFDVRQKMKTLKNSQGGCICGSVRYKIIAEPITLFACHCSDCQTVTGSGFVLALRIPYGGVTVIQGEARPYERTEADDRRRIIHRCPHCLTILWSERPDSKEYITIYGGTLDDSPTLRPVAHIWTREAQQWMKLPKDALQYEENPPDMQPIVDAWRRQNEKGA
jgi:hypothetical protein